MTAKENKRIEFVNGIHKYFDLRDPGVPRYQTENGVCTTSFEGAEEIVRKHREEQALKGADKGEEHDAD